MAIECDFARERRTIGVEEVSVISAMRDVSGGPSSCREESRDIESENAWAALTSSCIPESQFGCDVFERNSVATIDRV